MNSLPDESLAAPAPDEPLWLGAGSDVSGGQAPQAAPAAAPAPAGWYAEPTTGRQRYWDGQAWGAYAPAPPPPPGYAVASRATGTNGMAVASLVLGLVWVYGIGSIVAIVFGVIGRRQAEERNQGGRGLATAGLILGIVGLVGAAIIIIIALAASSDTSTYTY
jgi:hypothetical protein